MEKLLLYEQFRLIERSESEINGVWKGAHLLLFFLAFVFGSFCTFCFHMLMYMFDEKCVLFPKLLALTSIRHSILFEFKSTDNEKQPDTLPVDFLSTQWMEKSVCYLPTYVPLVSGIFGVVWTTIFLMCTTGSQVTGLQRPWRILPPVFVFSIVMCGVCIYSSVVTQKGLEQLCLKLSEFTGSTTCTYTVNVATLAYERRIRGVFQAIRLTIFSAWLHTACWFLSACVALARVLLVVDFQLVRITAELQGNVDKMLEHHETQIRTVSPDLLVKDEVESRSKSNSNKVQFQDKGVNTFHSKADDGVKESETDHETLFLSKLVLQQQSSELALVPEELQKVMGITIEKKNNHEEKKTDIASDKDEEEEKSTKESTTEGSQRNASYSTPLDLKQIAETQPYIKQTIYDFFNDYLMKKLYDYLEIMRSSESDSSEEKPKISKKSNLKNRQVQTEPQKDSKENSHRVQIAESEGTSSSAETQSSTNNNADKETQTQHKEKED